MSEVLLSVRDLKTWFGNGQDTVHAVDGVSFDLRRSETFALLGESGCGKSVTALSIMQLVPQPAGRIVSGSVLLEGRDLLQLPETAMRRIRGNRIAMIFQEPMTSLNPVLTVGDQIGESLRQHRGFKGAAQRTKVLELLDAVGIPDPQRRYGEYPHQLSGGMKQRVMIAIALAGEPELLIADEPTTALDVTIQAEVLELLHRLQRERGMALLLITHDLGVVAEMAERVAVMYAGQIVEQAPRKEFFAAPQHPYSRKLFESLPSMEKRAEKLTVIPGAVPNLNQEFKGCRFAPRCDYAWQACHETVPVWTTLSEGRGVRCHLADSELVAARSATPDSHMISKHQRQLHAAGKVFNGELLIVDGLKVHFPIHKGILKRVAGHVRAVDGVSFEIGKGHTLALVGESGCGKTTVGKGILQLVRPTAGNVLFEGEDLTRMSGAALRKERAKFQIIFQDPFSSMNPRMTVGDIIEEGMIIQGIGASRQERRARVNELLAHVGLAPEVVRRYPHEFSGGQRQRICIARALAVNPKLIVCDEPTSALDVSVQAQILNLLSELQKGMGLSFLFITHNLSVVAYLAHEVAVMYLGRVVERGGVRDVLDEPLHPYTQALLSAVPTIDPKTQREVVRLKGELPSPANPPRGCHFHPRCPHAMPVCRERYPDPSVHGAGRVTHCHLYA